MLSAAAADEAERLLAAAETALLARAAELDREEAALRGLIARRDAEQRQLGAAFAAAVARCAHVERTASSDGDDEGDERAERARGFRSDLEHLFGAAATAAGVFAPARILAASLRARLEAIPTFA